jgi:uncharacterized protein YfaS (alpha-2-macroglobulin family)
MKLFLILFAAWLPALMAFGLASDAQPDELKVVCNLSGTLQDLENKELAVTFSDGMLPLGGKRDGASLVRITPAVKGEFTWRGNRTLAFRPEPRLRYSTTYTAVIPAGTMSLSGKRVPREIRWRWSTPLAYPIEIKSSSQKYFSTLSPREKLDFQVWVKDPLVLRFNQPVSAATAGDFIVLRELKSGERVQARLVQKEADEIEMQWAGALKRGIPYEFLVKKGFHGSEGNTGTKRDFSFTFETVPPFAYAGQVPLILFPDAPHCRLRFSNPLPDAPLDDMVRVFRILGEKKTPLRFRLPSRYYEDEFIDLTIDEDLASGEVLRIAIDGNLANVYGERLGRDLELAGRVCSSRSPRIDFALRDGKLAMSANSMKRADIRLFKLKPAFHALLQKLEPGILQKREFRSEFLEKEVLQRLSDLPERRNQPEWREKELGSPLGFFAFLVQRYEPYNACGDASLMRLPAYEPPALHVFHRRHMDMVVKAGQKQTLFWLYDNRSGKGLGNRPFHLLRPGGEMVDLGTASAGGVLVSGRALATSDLIVAKDMNNEDMALARLDHEPPSSREVRITVFSDRDFYKPGDTVHVAGIVKEHVSGKVSSPKSKQATLDILGPDWQKVKSDKVELDSLGGFHYTYPSDPDGKKGSYRIQVRVADERTWQGQHAVTIDYYQPNTFEITLSGVAERYLSSDSFRPQVSGSYLAGNPMAGDSFTHTLSLAPAAARIFPSGNLERFSFALDDDLMQNDEPSQGGGKLDAGGKATLGIPLSRFPRTNYLADIHFPVTGRSAEGKEFTAYASSLFFPGRLATGIRLGYYHNLREPIQAELALVDIQGKPAAGEVRVSLYRERYENNRRRLEKAFEPRDLFIDKLGTHAFRVTEAGRYLLRIDTPDNSGRVVSTSHGFFAWDSGYSDRDDRLRIESEQSVLRSGETLKCFIRSRRAGQALVTVEQGEVLDSWVIPLQKMTPLELPVKKEYFPAVRVGVVAMYEHNASEEASLDFQVRDGGKSLKIDLDCAGEIKPASKAGLRVRVRDSQGRGTRAKLFVYAVDEGNLSLLDYRTPNPLQRFYYDSPLGRGILRNYFSKHFNHWTVEHPMMDITLPAGPVLFGRVFQPDAAPLAGATVTLEDKKFRKLRATTTSIQGYYMFTGIPAGRYAVKAEANGFHPLLQKEFYFSAQGHQACNMALIPVSADKYWDEPDVDFGVEGGVEGGALGDMAPAPMASEKRMKAQALKEELEITGKADIAGIRVRRDFREVLFFQAVDTDESGNAAIDFESSDQLSTYRVMAVAYGEESFGSAEKRIVVSKDLLISEAMPEFARQGDEFRGGVQLSNRTEKELAVTLLAKPEGIVVSGPDQVQRGLGARKNELLQFPFLADRVGEAKIVFYAVSAADKDGLEKKFPVTDCLVSEALLDFASGKNVKKVIAPQAEGEQQSVSIKAAPSILRPVVNIAKKLVFYPYECLEQRTSKVMPFLALSPQLAERLELGLDQKQIHREIEGYLKVIPEFMNGDGALSYYRGGQYPSDYLTAYVLWALHLAQERDYQVDPQLVQKLAGYLQRARLDGTCESFYQFVLSLARKADDKKLRKLAAERAGLPLPGKVFLYRALNNQGIEAGLLKTMLSEFNNSLQVEADFAYFDAGEFAYHREYPFYSSRFATAMILQAVLEVEHGHVLAERVINWLLEAEPHCWNTTQTNFWILCTMDEYLRQVEKKTARRAEIAMLGENTAKEFASSRDELIVQKNLDGRQERIEVTVQADQPIYVTSELTWKLGRAGKKSRGIDIQRNVYNEKGEGAGTFQRGRVYMVELLIHADKEVPYGVIDEPLAAGFELLRQDVATTRERKEFNVKNKKIYRAPWARRENAADRLVFYTYSMQGPMRLVYFIKAMYSGRFTWLPTVAQGMYHPQYFGRTAIERIEVKE